MSPWLKRWHVQGWRSDWFAGQNRKLTADNRIKEEKECCLLLLVSSVRTNTAGSLCWGIFPSQGVTGFEHGI